jgi:Zn-dependent peptidase ImmA (M78 family)
MEVTLMESDDPGGRLAIGPNTKYNEMRHYADSLGVTVASALLHDDLAGVYDDSAKTILIERRMTYTQKKCALTHELVHWSHGDCACDPMFHVKEEQRARKETAELLISELEYRVLESIFEGDIYKMADEMNVTPQVLKDFQSGLDNRSEKNANIFNDRLSA